ncbi:PPE domain-containing protein [Rhodococcus sp. IEGM 1354]|uniref:PPE domain-containing protein n=1 Tax=Rhodococcus sp. IEGM 1354 TaxID=3047088 RepID=UPI0024B6CF6A|nr:PPE domain-containing protein [Rhodococcus sp. IEGM 1354]MDI9929025.1 PPE domain-containing protein [Rhodococcus sp. IEGM 1354]
MANPYEELEATIDGIVTNIFVTPVGPELVGTMLGEAFEKANGEFDYRGDYEPNEVTITEPFEVMSHEDIAGMVGSLAIGPIATSSQNWNDLSAAAGSGSDGFRTGIEAAMASGWSGPMSDAVRGGVGDYVSSASALATSMSLIGNKLLEAHAGFEQTKSRMPPVVASESSTLIGSLLPVPFATKTATAVQEEQQNEARRIMRSVYVPGVVLSDTNVPVLPTAHNPVDGGGGGSTGGWAGGFPAGSFPAGSGGATSGGGAGSAGTVDPEAQSAAQQTGAGAAAPGQSGPGVSGSSPSGTLPPADRSGETRAAAAGGPGTGSAPGGLGSNVGAGGSSGAGSLGGGQSGSGYGGSGYGGSGYGGSSFNGSGGGSGGGMGSGAGYGGSVLGSPIGSSGSSGGPGGASAAAAGRAGAHGMPGVGGMGAAGGRGTGDNDGEHATPGYLIDVGNGSELIGDLPLVAPPVLGG